MNYLRLIILVISLLGIACTKKDEKRFIYIDEAVKDYMYFKKGTQWIYVSSADKEVAIYDTLVVQSDSVYLEEERFDKFRSGQSNLFTERFFYTTYNRKEARVLRYNGGCLCLGGNGGTNVCFAVHRRVVDFDEGSTKIFEYPFFIGNSTQPHGLTKVTLTDVYDSLLVGKAYYYKVVRMHETCNFTENGLETVFYMAPHYGIVRKEVNIDTTGISPRWKTWDLFQSIIIQ